MSITKLIKKEHHRSLAMRRHHRDRVIMKKKRFIKRAGDYWYIKFDGMHSKGKIHCSCWMCSTKTRIHGYRHSDQMRMARFYEEEQE